MSEKIEQGFKVVSVSLGAVILLQLFGILRAGGNVDRLEIPVIEFEEQAAPDSAPAESNGPKASAPNFPPGMPPSVPPGMPPGMPMMMPGGPGPMPRGGGAPLDPKLQARVDVIVKSEMFGPVPKPPPMALMGIAGRHIMLRADNGQTGLIAVGESLGNVKLLQIGTNRVLIEKDGKQQELTIFSGQGGESLLKKE